MKKDYTHFKAGQLQCDFVIYSLFDFWKTVTLIACDKTIQAYVTAQKKSSF